MYRSILVPLDGTPFGEHALPLARGLARGLGAVLHLVHVHAAPPAPLLEEGVPPHIVPPGAAGPTPEERAYLESLAERLRRAGLQVSAELVQGPLTESIERCAAEKAADLVVVCTHAHGGLSRLWHRGVGEQLLQDISIPIVLIRPAAPEADLDAERVIRHILLPLGGQPGTEAILEWVAPLAEALGAELTLLRVVRPVMVHGYTLLGQDAHVNHFLLERQQGEARAYLAPLAERLRAAGLRVHVRVEVSEDIAHVIVSAARPEAAGPDAPPVDLIAMTTHSPGTLTRAIFSSITDEVLHEAPLPLLLQHVRAAPAAARAAEAAPATEELARREA